jgi:hypothetical protein
LKRAALSRPGCLYFGYGHWFFHFGSDQTILLPSPVYAFSGFPGNWAIDDRISSAIKYSCNIDALFPYYLWTGNRSEKLGGSYGRENGAIDHATEREHYSSRRATPGEKEPAR